MKKRFLFIIIFFITLHADAQSGIFFQAIARDNNANPAKERKIYIESNIIQGSPTGTKVLTEEHQTNSDAFGIFTIMVGNGLRLGGTATSLSTIDWANGPYYLNMRIVITPVGVGAGWDYTKEWLDIGTTIFGSVPFALYSANGAKIDEKLNIIDTSKMLMVYAKAKTVQTLSSTIDTKLTSKDTVAMLAPYAKMATKFDLVNTIKYTKQAYTDSALLTKMNLTDTINYAKQKFVDAGIYSQQKYIEFSLATKLNSADTIKYAKQVYLDTALTIKLNSADTIRYTKKIYTDSALLTKLNLYDTSVYAKKLAVDAALYTKLNIVDTIKFTKKVYSDSALQTKLSLTGNATTATFANTANTAITALTAGNITATGNTTLTSLQNLNIIGTISSGVWSATTIDIAHGGTGLNTAGRTGQVLTTASDGTFTWTSLTTQTATHSIGESFGGGIVFYVWDNGRHGLIAATSNLSVGGISLFTWGPTANYVMAIRNGINAGMYNTERIIIKQGAGIGNYAALIAAHYQFNGNGWGDYGDWYLPSKYELQLLFKQKNVVGGFSNTTYVWSSTEADDKTAYTINFFSTNGTLQAEAKNLNPRFVRAIRSF